MPKVTWRGLQEAQKGMLKKIASMKPGGALDEAVRFATIAAFNYALVITHVETGALRLAHRMKLSRGYLGFGGSTGTIYIDPNAPGATRKGRKRVLASRVKPSVYGPAEHNRGGEHAFYERVPAERGNTIARQAAAAMVRSWQSG